MVKRYFVLTLGQSNMEPKASFGTYRAFVPDMDYALSGNEALKQIRYLTFYNGQAEAAHSAGYPTPLVPAPAPFGDAALEFQGYERYCTWQPWTASNAPVNPPVGFRYPNAQCFPQETYTTSLVSVGVDWARRVMNWLSDPIHVVHVAIDSTSLAHSEVPVAGTTWTWFNANRHTNWAPADDDAMFQRMRTVLDGLALRLQEDSDTGACLAVLMLQGETDAQNDPWQSDQFSLNAPRFVEAVRNELGARNLLDTSPRQLPFIWPKIQTAVWNSVGDADAINNTLAEMAIDDEFFETFSVDSMSFGGGIHYDAQGVLDCADEVMAAFLRARSVNTIAMSSDDVPTLDELRASVRRIVQRNSDDAGQENVTVDEAINDQYLEMISEVGDTAWWLRQIWQYTVASAPDLPINLPRRIGRLIEMRPSAYPWVSHDWSMMGHDDQGRVRIITLQSVNELCDLHFMHEPLKLVAASEKPALPINYIECLKVGAARRLAHNAGNAKIETKLMREATRLKGQMFEHANKVDRQRRERLRGRRRTQFRRKPWENSSYYPWRDGN